MASVLKTYAPLTILGSLLMALSACGGGGGSGGGTGSIVAPPASSSTSSSSSSGSSGSVILTPATPATSTVTFQVHSDQNRLAISPYIYGMNNADFTSSAIQALNLTMGRFGGNRTSAYNWVTNASNAGSDYYFENDNYLTSSNVPGAAFTGGMAATLNAASGNMYLVTVPMTGYVSADENGGGSTSGDVGLTNNWLTTRFHESVAAKGAAFTTSPSASTPIVYQDEMVNYLKVNYPTAFSGTTATIAFQLDNEVDLWAATHARLRGIGISGNSNTSGLVCNETTTCSGAITYAELMQRTEKYATAIKNVAPNALIYGPVSYGYEGYISLQNASDSAANGDFLTYYLKTLKAFDATAGHRSVDVLDLHYYSSAVSTTNVVVTAPDDSAAVQAARAQSVRSLYDATYVESSWITCGYATGSCINNVPLNLIPTEMAKINANYPGTKLSFTEYNFGGGDDVSGAVAEADALGAFGALGVYAADLWTENTVGGNNNYAYGAIKAFRNIDGAGAAFGNTSIKAATNDIADTSIYASVDQSTDHRMVLVLINRSASSVTTGTQVWHNLVFGSAVGYQISGSNYNPTSIGNIALNNNSFNLTLPAYSVTTVVLTY